LTSWATDNERTGNLAGIEVASFRSQNLVFGEQRAAKTNAAGVLGLGFMRRYIVTFDFPSHLIYLRKSKFLDEPELVYDLSGLQLLAKNGRVVVAAVDQDSPAAKSGIKTHDMLRRVDGNEALPQDLYAIRRMLCTPGKTVRLAIEPDGRMIDVVLRLEPNPEAVADSDAGREPSQVRGTR
jgi:predicted metalloprotease with PDZ domain